MFAFNDKADAWVVKPVAQTYKVVPEAMRMVVGNIIRQRRRPLDCRQPAAAGQARRCRVRSLSLHREFDTSGSPAWPIVASEMGFERHREDFGQTLGRWGLASGPYLVLPIFGPSSSVRDGRGLRGRHRGRSRAPVATEGPATTFA
jgi:phospholipid-binding lipoprotein MlaA